MSANTRDPSASRNDLAARSFRDASASHNDLPYKRYDGSGNVPQEYILGGECLICHTPFEGLHLSVKITCSDKCRQKLQRYRKEVETDFEKMLDLISGYEDMILIPELKGQAREKLEQIQSLISEILESEE